MTIVNSIKKLRADRKITQEDLARAVKVSRQTIIAMEKGNYVPSLLLAMQLADYFKVRVEELFTIK
jgi:putative transcriptional regulator